MHIDHIGYAVQNLQDAAKTFILLGYSPISKVIKDDARQVFIQIFESPDGVKIEVIAPSHENSPVTNWLGKNGSSPYHICYKCKEIEKTILRLKKAGCMPIISPCPAPALENKRVVFLYSQQVGLFELVEEIL